MESGRLFFDPSASRSSMLFLGNGDSIFRGGRLMMSTEDSSKRRPFFSSPDDLFDDCYYDEQSPEKKRRLTAEQVDMLEKSFEADNKLEPERKTQLAKKLGLQPRQVAVWFQNRRARWKNKQLERDYDLLKSSYDALLSNYEVAVKEIENLKSEVVSLNEKLQAKEENKEGKKDEPLPADLAQVSALGLRNKVEDHLSSGSGGSAVVDEDGPQIVDSGDSISYFPTDAYPGCMGPVDRVQSEEDDGSDDGRSYNFSDVLLAAENQEHEESLRWWFW